MATILSATTFQICWFKDLCKDIVVTRQVLWCWNLITSGIINAKIVQVCHGAKEIPFLELLADECGGGVSPGG